MSERFPWWPWRRRLSRFDPPQREVAQVLGRVVAGDGDPQELEEALRGRWDASLEEVWEAVSSLHRSLDAVAPTAPPGELDEARGRLNAACARLWSAGAELEGRVHREFIREVAHDLRSPLHSILFLTDGLYREESGSLTRAQKRQVGVIHSAAAALMRLTNDVLDFSRHDEEEGRIHEPVRAPFSPGQVVSDLEDLLEPLVHHHEASLEAETLDTASRLGDPQLLNRVLLNLTCNALEAAGEDGSVRLEVDAKGDNLRALVADDGDAVDVDELRAFVEGSSGRCLTRKLGGQTRGLGLVICGRLVRAAGGELSVERTDDGWTRFLVSLPFPTLEAETG